MLYNVQCTLYIAIAMTFLKSFELKTFIEKNFLRVDIFGINQFIPKIHRKAIFFFTSGNLIQLINYIKQFKFLNVHLKNVF